MPRKKRKSTKARKPSSPFGKVGNWGESSWNGGNKRSKPDSYNKTMAKAFK